MQPKSHTYTFNRPVALLLAVPLLALLTMMVLSLVKEFNLVATLMAMVTVAVLVAIVLLGFGRRVRIAPEGAHWLGIRSRWTLPRRDIRHFGVLKYRSFRFIYLSTAEAPPFMDPASPVVADAETVLFQYRPGAWTQVQAWIRATHPTLAQEDLQRN